MPAMRGRVLIVGAGVAAVCVGVAVYLGVAWAAGPPRVPAEATPTPGPSLTERPTPAPTPTPSASPSPSPSPSPLPTPIPPERVTLLVLGSDGDAARVARGEAPRIDSIIVATVNAARDEIALISIPRDTVDIPMPDGSTWTRKINALYAQRGVDAMRGAVETLLGIRIDRHVVLNMDDFRRLTDAVGGVDVTVPFAMHDPKVRLSIGAGPQRLSGVLALKYVRSRSLDGDYGRSGRQQDLLLGLARAMADPGRVADPAALLVALSSLQTDVELADLQATLEIVRASREAAVTKVVLKPPDFALFAGLAGDRGWVMIPNVTAMRMLAAETFTD
jgi:LCP family protein required for cell wall assembly